MKIPVPTLSRLCKIHSLLEEYRLMGLTTISSQKIEKIHKRINESFGFNKQRHACIIGLVNLGSLFSNGKYHTFPCFSIITGFDSHTNILETLQTSIPIYPTYDIPSMLKKERIELAIITEPDQNMKTIMDPLIEGGIRGIINTMLMIISYSEKSIIIRNLDIFTEFRYLPALFTLNAAEI